MVEGNAGSLFPTLARGVNCMAGRKDPTAVLKKWQTNAGNAGESIKAGVNAVTSPPSQQAANAADLWQQQVSSQTAKDKFVQNLQKVTLQDWKNAMLDKGVSNYQNGIRGATQKMQRFLTAFLPVAAASSEQVKAMPKGTEADSIARMVQNMRNMKAFAGG